MIHQIAISHSNISLHNSSFLREIIKQVRVQDTTVAYQDLSDELLLKSLIGDLTLEGDNDIPSLQKISAFYRAVASRLEQETGQMAEVFLNLGQDDVGWILVFCGRLLVISQFLRDADSFGFESVEHLADFGERMIQNSLERAREYFDFPVQGISVPLKRAS
jgi:probable nitrogen fixation protein